MTLRQKQNLFAGKVATLITWLQDKGYQVTFGEAYRPIETAALMAKTKRGISNSLHTIRLAIDLNLFKDGKYLDRTEQYREAGLFWESIGGTWGGRFNDGNHFSIEHDGRK